MNEGFDILTLLSGLIGGLALFLYGMNVLTGALKLLAGNHMKNIQSKMTANRFSGMVAGAVTTAIIQSSSITTVLLVGFISAGLMTTHQSVAVIIGANIGTTITAQILAFKVSKFALPILAIGFFASVAARDEVARQYGKILFGLGLVFFGMAIMSEAMVPLRDYQPFIRFMASLDNPLFAALAGAAFTALIQSSSATTGVLIVMVGQGLVSLETAIALALGANIGTCVTAWLAAIGRSSPARRAALIHVIFNTVGVLIWIGLIDQLASAARFISPAQDLGETQSIAIIPRQIANVHTIFNVANALLFIGFTKQLTQLVEWLIPEKPVKKSAHATPKFLDRQFLGTPDLALDATRREIVRLGNFTMGILVQAMPIAISGSIAQLRDLRLSDKPVDELHQEIVGYLREVSLSNLSARQSQKLMSLIRIANSFEHIGDQIATGMATSASKRINENIAITDMTANALSGFHKLVGNTLKDAITALETEDEGKARQVIAMEVDMAEMVEAMALHEFKRLQTDEPQRLTTYTREVELVEILDDIFSTTRQISQTQLRMSAQPPESAAKTPNNADGEPPL